MKDIPMDQSTQDVYEARKAARESRKAFVASPDSAFVRTMQSAISQYLKARDNGVTREAGINGIEEELRGAWPKTVSKFAPACDACDDTGWMEYECAHGGRRCGRPLCAITPERHHTYVVPCGCAAGDRKRPKTRSPESDISAVGRTQKKRGGFTRFGR